MSTGLCLATKGIGICIEPYWYASPEVFASEVYPNFFWQGFRGYVSDDVSNHL